MFLLKIVIMSSRISKIRCSSLCRFWVILVKRLLMRVSSSVVLGDRGVSGVGVAVGG